MNEEQIRDEARKAANGSQFSSNYPYDHKSYEDGFYEGMKQALSQPTVGGSASDFERELYKLINEYVSAGLKKPDLVHKMEYVTQSCRVSYACP